MKHTDIKDKVMKGGKLAIERLIEKKRKDNSYVVISVNGKVMKVDANSLKR